MSIFKMKLLSRSRKSGLHGGSKAERMEWIKQQLYHEEQRLRALTKLGDRWVYAKPIRKPLRPGDLIAWSSYD